MNTTGRRKRRDMYQKEESPAGGNHTAVLEQMKMMSAYLGLLDTGTHLALEDDIMSNYLQCSGMMSNGCIEFAVCEAANHHPYLTEPEAQLFNM